VVDGNEHFPSWHFDAVLRFNARTSGRGSPFHSLGRMRMLNIVLAFFVAPFVALLFTSPLVAALGGELRAWGLYFGFGLFFAYASTALFALPLYALATRLTSTVKLWHCMLGGFIVATPVCVLEFNPFTSSRSMQVSVMYVVFSIATGVVAGAVFWQVRRVLDREDSERAKLRNAP
jgi:hypothetical protein